jgi:hypothetical protein
MEPARNYRVPRGDESCDKAANERQKSMLLRELCKIRRNESAELRRSSERLRQQIRTIAQELPAQSGTCCNLRPIKGKAPRKGTASLTTAQLALAQNLLAEIQEVQHTLAFLLSEIDRFGQKLGQQGTGPEREDNPPQDE